MNLSYNIPLLKKKRQYPKQVRSAAWEDRSAIVMPEVNLFCWERPEEVAISRYLEHVLSRAPEPVRCTVQANDLKKGLQRARTAWDSASTVDGDLFWQDVFVLTQGFLSTSKTDTATLHLKVIRDDACSKFHIDGYRLRLFTTYYGKGTEWLPEAAVNRSGLGKSNAMIVKDASQVQRMGTFHVGILKGEVPIAPAAVRGIVHRSPGIAATGESRIILRIDI